MTENILHAEEREIEAYTSLHPELSTAHHFVFNEIHPCGENPLFVIMGINPGESAQGPVDGKTPWTKRINEYVGGRAFVMTELFFWSSKNLTQFRERFGILEESPHLDFCIRLNKRLIDVHKPRAVVCPGLGLISLCKTRFDLTHAETGRRRDGARVYEVFKGEHGIPWIFTKHWTGARGFTNEDKLLIKTAIQREAPRDD